MILSALLTSVGINLGLCFLFFTLYSILRKQPGNVPVYGPRLIQDGESQQTNAFNLERLLPTAGWVKRALQPSNDEILSNLGLDALVFIRVFVFSIRVFSFASVVGIFILLPVNYMGTEFEEFFDLPKKSLDSFSIFAVTLINIVLLSYGLSFICVVWNRCSFGKVKIAEHTLTGHNNIYHRDIKSTNIMLDEKCRAKVSDFGTSRSVTVDHTHLTTMVSGTVGYVDPEYFQSSQFTDKSDVYSFGVVLVELITGAKAISYLRSEENRTLATYFILAMKENRLEEIIDARIKEECKLEQVKVAAKLARKCLNLKGKKRPSMREVSMELERLRSLHGHPQPQIHVIESDVEDEIMEMNIAMESWDSVNEAVTGHNVATSFLDVEPLFPRQT
ncbi:hypothetical protein N665_0445s0031 [Sinapis alba]|nr:hypothetical protein N665_0445s0031 [Sinapis alba]